MDVFGFPGHIERVYVKFVGVKKQETRIQTLMCHFLLFSATFYLSHYAVRQTRARRIQSGLKSILLPGPRILRSLALYSGPFLWWEESSIGNEGKSTRPPEKSCHKNSVQKRRKKSRVWPLWIRESNVCGCCRTSRYEERERERKYALKLYRLSGRPDGQGSRTFLLFVIGPPGISSAFCWGIEW